jgi:hypothetical protein
VTAADTAADTAAVTVALIRSILLMLLVLIGEEGNEERGVEKDFDSRSSRVHVCKSSSTSGAESGSCCFSTKNSSFSCGVSFSLSSEIISARLWLIWYTSAIIKKFNNVLEVKGEWLVFNILERSVVA